MTNGADPDQLDSSEANWFGSTLFAKAVHIWVQHDQGQNVFLGFFFFFWLKEVPYVELWAQLFKASLS